MKKLSLILVLMSMIAISYAQSPKYTVNMKKTLATIEKPGKVEDLMKAANTFERIGNVEKGEWLPNYYQSYCYMMMAVRMMQKEPAKMNEYVDKAQEALDKIKDLAKGKDLSEVLTLQGFIYQGRIWENPQVKGMVYGPQSATTLQKAMEANPDNPRPYYLLGQNTLYTPAMWGGGAGNAKPLLVTAKEKFEKFELTSDIHPNWGAYNNSVTLKLTEDQLAKTEENK